MQYPSQEFYRQVEHIKPGERKRTMNQREETEIAQKLADLKAYQEQYDQAEHAMQRARNQAETLAHWHSMNEAERRYETAFNWLEAYGYIIKWSKVRQVYEAYKDNTS